MERYAPVPLAFDVILPDEYDYQNTPVIFLHGMTRSKENWSDLIWHTADITESKVYALDARNHGDSPWSQISHFDSNVDDLIHFMNTHNLPSAILVGHSMGGITAIKTALRVPERIEKIVVEDMTAKSVSPQIIDAIQHKLQLVKSSIEKLPAGLDEEEAKEFIANYIYEALPPDIKEVSRIEKNGYELKKTDDGRFVFKTNMDILPLALDSSKDLMSALTGRYEGPACFIYGKLSQFDVASDEDYIKEFFPNAEFVGIENATHSVHDDCNEEFSEILFDFLLRD
ncbi:hypothetical protein NPIL_554261 [Nephila pilipes]|uniref:sn-1-specific diacylglycerol lipase ABHD11 n=1 Tax=Nephila pilipes TaxID=299642 RepID=A0A8X6TMQ4_NEPPI|nr:hypothetical protein NPIL_554261 [Nephila pilipes]